MTTIANNVFFDDPKCKGLNCSNIAALAQKELREEHEERQGERTMDYLYTGLKPVEHWEIPSAASLI